MSICSGGEVRFGGFFRGRSGIDYCICSNLFFEVIFGVELILKCGIFMFLIVC